MSQLGPALSQTPLQDAVEKEPYLHYISSLVTFRGAGLQGLIFDSKMQMQHTAFARTTRHSNTSLQASDLKRRERCALCSSRWEEAAS